ncbi:MAG: cysteine--tRNA ligase [Bacilli bacterium]
MNLYNTKSNQIEPFIPYNGTVTMYTCGPTVYHYAHIGNLRSYIMEDILEKSLNFIGYHVKRCMNITDVGHLSSDSDSGVDKMVKGAIREHKTVLEIAQMYTDAFFNDIEKLNIKKPEIIVPATSCINDYINIIKELLEKKYAYISNGNVYFDVSKLDDYYVLTNHKVDEMVVGARENVIEDISKKNQADFVLWFTKSKFTEQELKWDSPWGYGYPGWHIECSAISIKYLGEHLDIHCGGVDNIFPHHTNEIAQSESYLGHPWCNYWFHVEHLNDSKGKMSKSSGEFLTLDLLMKKGYNPLVYRLFCLLSHYRKQLVFSYEGLDMALNIYNKLISKIKSLKDNHNNINYEIVDKYTKQFKNSLNNDLNTSLLITTLYDVLKEEVNDETKLHLVKLFDKVLSLDLLKETSIDLDLQEFILKKIDERKIAKIKKDFKLSDQIRKELELKGIYLNDTREGTTYEIK